MLPQEASQPRNRTNNSYAERLAKMPPKWSIGVHFLILAKEEF